jgi:hypothetical protein
MRVKCAKKSVNACVLSFYLSRSLFPPKHADPAVVKFPFWPGVTGSRPKGIWPEKKALNIVRNLHNSPSRIVTFRLVLVFY